MEATPESQVRVRQGVLQGKKTTTCNGREYYSFEGIPYAQPPVGELRFRPPQPVEPWTGIKDATKPGNRCAQKDFYNPKAKFQGSEDCLYLNVYTPTLPRNGVKKYPVIFYFHGGRSLIGYGDYYRPDFYLEQDCIVVTINYRLHILGYLCLNIKEVPGNAGLKDSICALRWVNENIGAFNGDGSIITLFGESAGSGMVSAILSSNMAGDLFQKAITETGSCLADLFMRTSEDVIEKARTVCKFLGKDAKNPEEMLHILQNTEIESLINAVNLAQGTRGLDPSAYFLPVVEKHFPNIEAFYLEDPWIVYQEGRFKKVPMISGTTSKEAAYFLQRDDKDNVIYNNDLELMLPKYLGLKKGSPNSKKMADSLRKFYFGDNELNDTLKREYLDFVNDAYFNRDLTITLDYQSKFNSEVYYFIFDYEGNLNTRVMKSLGLPGAAHGDVLPYQFYRKSKMNNCSEKDWEVIRFFSEAFSNFAKYGKPTWSNQEVEWLPYTQKRRYCLEIGATIKYVPYRFANRVEIWKKFMSDKSKL